jgi:uncharacterized membrane protein SpoIIM required for sporulation
MSAGYIANNLLKGVLAMLKIILFIICGVSLFFLGLGYFIGFIVSQNKEMKKQLKKRRYNR